MIRITQDPLDAAALLQDFSRDRLDTGAVVSFTGLTRGRTGDRIVDTLTLEAYPGFTERVMEEIEADARARFEIQDALTVHRWGRINVGEPVKNLYVLRFRTQREIEAFQASRAQCFIDEASRELVDDGIACRGVFKQGDVVFSILDTAEELDCDEVVMPAQAKGLCGMFTRSKADAVRRQQRHVPVVLIDRQGMPR